MKRDMPVLDVIAPVFNGVDTLATALAGRSAAAADKLSE
jgi:hypothetical protein